MSKEILFVVDSLANEKLIEKEVIFEALEAALANATQKRHNSNMMIEVKINRETGEYETFRCWTVVADEDEEALLNPDKSLSLTEAQNRDSSITIGAIIRESFPSVEFGRIAAQNARQVLLQKVREAERNKIVRGFLDRVGQLVTGVVKRVTRDCIFVDLGGNAEGVLPREYLIPREVFRAGDRIRTYLYEVKPESKSNPIMLSRTHNNMLVELFRIEVPEVGEGVIEIMGAAREPGIRAKLAVKTNDGRIDPIGACIGMRGSRVQTVSSELCGERIDIILWDPNPAQFVINSLAPAEVVSIVVDEENHSMDIAVLDEQLSQAIGRNGQNIRLASELTGWQLNIMGKNEAVQKSEAEIHDLQAMFVEHLDVEEELSAILVREGFTTIEEIAYVPMQELLSIEEFDEEIVKALRDRAKDILLTQAIAGEEKTIATHQPAKDLLELKGMTAELAAQMANHEIITREDLADQSVDELVDLLQLDRNKAAELIMTAREPWFAK